MNKPRRVNKQELENRLTKLYRQLAAEVRRQADFVENYRDDSPVYENGVYGEIGKSIDGIEADIAQLRKDLGNE